MQHIHEKDLNLCLPLYYYGMLIVDLKKTQKVFNCVYGACNMTKWYFEIPIYFWFQLMSLRNLFHKSGTFP